MESLPGFPFKFIVGQCAKVYLAAIVSLLYLSRQHGDVGICCQGASALLCKYIPNVSGDVSLLELGFLWVSKASNGSSCVLLRL